MEKESRARQGRAGRGSATRWNHCKISFDGFQKRERKVPAPSVSPASYLGPAGESANDFPGRGGCSAVLLQLLFSATPDTVGRVDAHSAQNHLSEMLRTEKLPQ
jgi:hypothetical protein